MAVNLDISEGFIIRRMKQVSRIGEAQQNIRLRPPLATCGKGARIRQLLTFFYLDRRKGGARIVGRVLSYNFGCLEVIFIWLTCRRDCIRERIL
jgi:hypothetical protein